MTSQDWDALDAPTPPQAGKGAGPRLKLDDDADEATDSDRASDIARRVR